MTNTAENIPPAAPPFDMDAAMQAHEVADVNDGDIKAVAQLFNNVGTGLTAIDHQNLGDGKKALQLNKEAITRGSNYHPVSNVSSQPKSSPGPRPGPPPPPVRNMPDNEDVVVTISHSAYEKQMASVAAVKRKITKLEKDIKTINQVLELPNTVCRYKIVTDDVDCVCSNIHTLLNIFTTEVQKKPSNLTITKC